MISIAYSLITILSFILHGVEAATLRIMPLGDALTAGYKKVPGAYRTRLVERLNAMGYTTEFVGNEYSGDMSHEGHRNFDIADMTDYVEEFLDAYDPDIILLMIGSKDVLEDGDFEKAAERYDRLIHKIASVRPSLHIFAANLPPRKDFNQNNQIQDFFNPEIPTIVSAHQSAGRRVTFVDVNAVVSISDLATNLQPSIEGYAAIGKAFASAIANVITPNLAGLSRGILRVEGSLDRRQVTVTFTKPLQRKRGIPSNFVINKNLAILGATFEDQERRVLSLSTSEQTPGETYKLKVLKGIQGDKEMFFTSGWRMLVFADWHLGEKYVFSENQDQITSDVEIIQYLKENYQGEILMIPGDTNAGFWDTDEFYSKMIVFLGKNISREQAVLEAGNRCYSGLLSSFRFGGYPNVLAAIGDHELGDNAWEKNSMKSWLQPHFRQAFASNFNHDYNGAFKYSQPIGNANSYPLGTKYAETSFAYVYKNTLIVTVDVLYQQNSYTDIGSLGTVTGQVNGDHLQWLDNVLGEGSALADVKHIIVQGHFPVIYPVRKTKSSGIYMDDNVDSEFWNVLRRHPVDVFFAGEAHLNTVSKDPQSDILQIVSRGNFFSNFLSIDFTNDTIYITSYDEVGSEKNMQNFNYAASGHIQIFKTAGSKSITATGELSLFDPDDPIIYFNFESKGTLQDRHVLGLGELPGVRRSPTVTSVEIDGKECAESLINVGAFGQDYDAQSTTVELTSGVYGLAGVFTADSRAAIYGMGPHAGTHPISYTLWFKTTSFGARTLLSYEGFWVADIVLNLRLRDGKPEVVYSASQKMFAKNGAYNDGIWHHIAITMPFNGSKLSEIKLYVDGVEVETTLVGNDSIIDLPNGGMMSVGSFGYGGIGSKNVLQRDGFMQGLNFEGAFDDIMVFARSLSHSEIMEMSSTPKSFALRSKISYVLNEAMCLGFDLFGNGVVLRSCTDADGQQWIQDALGYIHNKLKYEKCLVPEENAGGSFAVKVKDCNSELSNFFSWTLDLSSVSHDGTDTLLVVNSNMNNAVELSSEDENDPPGQAWDILYEGDFASSYLTGTPSFAPTKVPTATPSGSPSARPSSKPTSSPTTRPSTSPSASPTSQPTLSPTSVPSSTPTVFPTDIPSTEPSPSPTQIPSVSVSPTVDICMDKGGTIPVNGKEKSCENARSNPKQCTRFGALRSHCPVSCGICESQEPTPAPAFCKDTDSSFMLPSGNMKTCDNAQKNSNLCVKNIVRMNCPFACNACDFPSEAPSPFPTDPPAKQIITLSPTPAPVPTVAPPAPVPTVAPPAPVLTLSPTPAPVPTLSPTPAPVPTVAPGPCEDNNQSFTLLSGRTKTCANAQSNINLCDKNIVQRNCPVTCDVCGSPVMSPVQPPQPECKDTNQPFTLLSGKTKTCANAQNNANLCDKNIVQRNCPVTCDVCDDIQSDIDIVCEDKTGKVLLPNGKKKGCWQARNNNALCTKFSELRAHCPKSCDACDP